MLLPGRSFQSVPIIKVRSVKGLCCKLLSVSSISAFELVFNTLVYYPRYPILSTYSLKISICIFSHCCMLIALGHLLKNLKFRKHLSRKTDSYIELHSARTTTSCIILATRLICPHHVRCNRPRPWGLLLSVLFLYRIVSAHSVITSTPSPHIQKSASPKFRLPLPLPNHSLSRRPRPVPQCIPSSALSRSASPVRLPL